VVTVHRRKISKISDIATITTFFIPPSFTRNPGILSDDPGQALSVVVKTSIYPSMQRYLGSIAPCDHSAQTLQTDGQTTLAS